MMFYVTLMPHWRFSKDDNCIHMPLLQIFKNQLNHPPKRIYIFKLKHCLYWIIFVKQYNSMFRINCTSTCFYVINTIVCYLNEIGWSNWFDSCIHCDAPFWKNFAWGGEVTPRGPFTQNPAPGRLLNIEHMYLYYKLLFCIHIKSISCVCKVLLYNI